MSKEKLCPLLKKNCVEGQCNFFNPVLSRCDISLLVYNLYRLSEIERERLKNQSDSSRNIPSFPHPKSSISGPMGNFS